MVNKCVAVGCTTGCSGGTKASCFHFPFSRPDLLERWTRFVGRKDTNGSQWIPNPKNDHEVLCSLHFDSKYINVGKNNKRKYLNWNMKPVPTIQTVELQIKPSCIPLVTVPRKLPTIRVYREDEYSIFLQNYKISSFDELNAKHSPSGFQFQKNDKQKTCLANGSPLFVRSPR